MIRFACATITIILLIGCFALAQDSTPKIQVFGGYSLLHEDTDGLHGITFDLDLRQFPNTFAVRSNFNGWSAEAQYNVGRWIGVAADFSGFYGSPLIVQSPSTVAGVPNGNSYSVLVGPVISYRARKKITPYAHALFGWDRTSVSASTFTGTAFPLSATATTFTDFAMALGGGIDYKVSRHFALRLGQADWFRTSLNQNTFYNSVFDTTLFPGFATRERNVRLSTGVVVSF